MKSDDEVGLGLSPSEYGAIARGEGTEGVAGAVSPGEAELASVACDLFRAKNAPHALQERESSAKDQAAEASPGPQHSHDGGEVDKAQASGPMAGWPDWLVRAAIKRQGAGSEA